jgi:hypothetical protein
MSSRSRMLRTDLPSISTSSCEWQGRVIFDQLRAVVVLKRREARQTHPLAGLDQGRVLVHQALCMRLERPRPQGVVLVVRVCVQNCMRGSRFFVIKIC